MLQISKQTLVLIVCAALAAGASLAWLLGSGLTPQSANIVTPVPVAATSTVQPGGPSGGPQPGVSGDSSTVVTFAVWDEERSAYQPMADAFHAQNPDIIVQFVSLNRIVPDVTLASNELQSTSVQNPIYSLPSVVKGADTAAVEIPAEALTKGYVLDLAPFAQTDPSFDSADFYTSTLSIASTNGAMYMLPSYLRVSLLSYNKELWAANGLQPMSPVVSWSEVLTAAARLATGVDANPRRFGLVDGGEGFPSLVTDLRNVGIDLDPADGGRLDRPEAAQAFNKIAGIARSRVVYIPAVSGKAIPAGSRPPGETSDPGARAVIEGRVGVWSPNLFMGSENKLTYETGTFVVREAPVGLDGYIISRGTQHPQEAWKWLSFLSHQSIPWSHGGASPEDRVPVRRSIAEQAYWQNVSPDTAAAVKALLDQSVGPSGAPVHLNWLRFSPDILTPALSLLASEQVSTDTVLAAVQNSVERLAPPDASSTGPVVVPTAPAPTQAAGTPEANRGSTPTASAVPLLPADVVISPDTTLEQFYEIAFRNLALRDPETFTQYGLPADYAPGFQNNILTELSDSYMSGTYAMAASYLAQLRGYDPATQSDSQRLSTSILDWYLDDMVNGQQFAYYDYLVNPLFGVQNTLQDFMTNVHPIKSGQDARDYVARLHAFAPKFDGLLEVLGIREEQGIFPPRYLVENVLGQMRDFVSIPAEENALYTSFVARVDPLTDLGRLDKEALYAEAKNAITADVYPSYRRLVEYFEQLEPKARDTDGVWALPNGDAYYAYALRHQTSSNLTPEQVHRMGLDEVARVQGELRKVLGEMGLPTGNLREAMQQVASLSGFRPIDTPEEKQQLLNGYRSLMESTSASLGDLFDIRPNAQVQVLAVPQYREAGAPVANYVPPALDGTRPGAIYVNLGRPVANYQMPGLAFHEGVPGHHFQLGIQTELQGVPTFRKAIIFAGEAEGWAVYTERLMSEANLYSTDQYGILGALQGELGRAMRMVVDTGIHYKKWTRQQAIDYMMENSASSEGAIQFEVDRYIAWPGQAASYGVGALTIMQLRERAKQELGANFDIKEFHDVVLQNGGMPLVVLEQVVDRYIEGKKVGS